MNDVIKYRQLLIDNNIKISYNDIIVRSVCLALKDVPILNSIINEGNINVYICYNRKKKILIFQLQ